MVLKQNSLQTHLIFRKNLEKTERLFLQVHSKNSYIDKRRSFLKRRLMSIVHRLLRKRDCNRRFKNILHIVNVFA